MEEKIYSQTELTEAFRAAIEDRATWFYLLLKASKKQGADIEKIAEEAITTFGKAKGKKFGEVNSPLDFIKKLSCGHARQAFAMEEYEGTEEKGVLRFKYCALVESWKKLGLTDKELSELCRLARYGDYGVISNFEDLKLEFGKLLSEGDEYCELIVTNK
jgi:hypothetical protein